MIYKVTKNGDSVITTLYYKNAAAEYDKAIYYSKPNDIIRLFCKKDGKSEWELARKDWV